MKSDLDTLMERRGFDALMIFGHAAENYPLKYITSGAHIGEGYVIKKRSEEPVLIVGPMERDEAAKSGLRVETYNDYDYYTLLKEKRSPFEALMHMLARMFERHEVRGTVAFYGLADPGRSYMMLTRLASMVEGVTITGETETSIFDEAFSTKDTRELEALHSVAERANQVMSGAIAFIQRHPVQDHHLLKSDGSPLTIGDVKRYIRASLIDHRLEDPEGTIFAMGRDAGVPHSRGEEDQPLELGQPIVFDLFPREIGGGYFHDMTRTFCLGYAPPEVRHAYDQVMLAFNHVMSELAVGEKTGRYQDLTCDIFEEMGHPTLRTHPTTTEGYVHGLGHGISLQIHSRPRLHFNAQETIRPGQVFTVEPGLYYPDRGFGVRIEDTIYVDEQGQFHSLTTYPKDLVIPVG